MISRPVLQRLLRDRRRNLFGWMAGIAAYIALLMAMWPSIRDSEGLQAAIDDYPEAIKNMFGGADSFDYSSATGFLNTQLFSLMLPLMFAVFAIGIAAATLAGEEESGRLAFMLSNPVSRRRVLISKMAGVLGSICLLAAGTFVVMVLADALLGMQVSVQNYSAALLGTSLMAAVYAFAALAAGAVSGRRGFSIAVSSAAMAVGYLMQVVASISQSLDWLRYLSPFYWATGSQPIANGLPGAEYAALVGVTALLGLGALLSFDRRDLRA